MTTRPCTARLITFAVTATMATLASVTTPMALAQGAAAPPDTYAVDIVDPAGTWAMQGTAMDARGKVVAAFTASGDDEVPTLWTRTGRQTLALPAGAAFLRFNDINADLWVAATAYPLSASHGQAMLWKPDAGGVYTAVDLGPVAGYPYTQVAGIDDAGRLYARGWNDLGQQAALVWETSTGWRNLAAEGYPDEPPEAVSPAGVVATERSTYQYGEPSSVQSVAPPPDGWLPLSLSLTSSINDGGVRASFLLSTNQTSIGLRAMARYDDASGWTVISASTPSASRYEIGRIDAEGTLFGTVLADGVAAYGADGVATSLAGRVSPAYGAVDVDAAGDHARNGQVMARITLGGAPMLVRLTPASTCTGAACMTVPAIDLRARNRPGSDGKSCSDTARTVVRAALTVDDGAGVALPGARVTARLLTANGSAVQLRKRTKADGSVTFKAELPACEGMAGIVVEAVALDGRTLDRTRGQLAASRVPR